MQIPEETLYEIFSRDQTLLDYQKQMTDLDREIARYQQIYVEPFASEYAAPLKQRKSKISSQKESRETELETETRCAQCA